MNNQYPLLTQECTEQLKGIAIILVIFSHLNLAHVFNFPLLKNIGDWGVAIFLILSGYGLAQSYLSKGLGEGWIKNRLTKIIPAYSLVTLIWIVVDIFGLDKTYSIKTIVLALIGMDFSRSIDPTMWYITFILICYILFFVVFNLPINNIYKVAIILLISLLYSCLYMVKLKYNIPFKIILFHFQLHILSFPVGILIGLYYSKLMNTLKKKANLVLALTGIISLAFFAVLLPSKNSLINLADNLFFAAGCIILLMFLQYYNARIHLLSLIGVISYELYLLEYAFITKYPLISLFPNKYISLLAYLVVVFILGIGLKNLFSRLTKPQLYSKESTYTGD